MAAPQTPVVFEDRRFEQFENLVRVCEQQFGPNHELTLAATTELGDQYAAHGEESSAEQTYIRALEVYVRDFGRCNPRAIAIADKLGLLYAKCGRLKEAESMFRISVDCHTQALGPSHERTLMAMNHLALVYADQGNLLEAEALYLSALEDMKRALGSEHQLTLITAHNLGLFYKNLNQLDEAENMYESALHGLEKTLGRHASRTLSAVNGFGMLRSRQGRLEEAEVFFKRAIEGWEALSAQAPDSEALALDPLSNLGNVYARQGKTAEAEATYTRALEGWAKLRGWSHKSTLNTANNLRRLYVDRNEPNKACRITEMIRERSPRLQLHIAAKTGELERVSLLLDLGFPVNEPNTGFGGDDFPRGCTPLFVAVFHGNAPVVEELLARGADTEATGWDAKTPLCVAARKNFIDIACTLLSNRANPNGHTGFPPLVAASAVGNVKMATLLLDKDAAVDEPDEDGDPALHSAAWNGHLDVVCLLLARGANPRSRGGSGRTALWFASRRKHEAIGQILRYHGADNQHPPDMEDDSSSALQAIGTDRLLADVEAAQSLMFEDSVAERWAQNLRLLVDARDSGVNGQRFDLELIEEASCGTEPFVAVSYCWASVSASADLPDQLRICDSRKGLSAATSKSEGIVRPARARSDVILRSLEFAASQGVKRVWIDQECIDQDDPRDVQVAVQSMHMVYRRAVATIAVLGKHVHTLDDMNGLLGLLPRLDGPLHYTKDASDRLRDRILGDKWFTRAWCTQEDVNSTATYYTIGWKDGTDADGQAWERYARLSNENPDGYATKQIIRRTWVLSPRAMWNMSFYSPGRRQHVMLGSLLSTPVGHAPSHFTLLDGSNSRELKENQQQGLQHDQHPNSLQQLPSRIITRHRMPLTTAWQILVRRRNLLVSDRLAILSNLTRYRFRINTGEVVAKSLSFTACVLALALQNGDVGSLCLLSGGHAGSVTGSWLPYPNFSLNSHGRGIPSGSFLTPSYDGDPAYVIGGKGLFCGLIWGVEAYKNDEFTDIAEALPSLLELATAEGQNAEPLVWIKLILQLLLRHFVSTDQLDLAELIIMCSLERPLKDLDEGQFLLSRIKSWAEGRDDEAWPSELLRDQPWDDNVSGQPQRRLAPLDGFRPKLHWICNQIVTKKSFPIGRCVVPVGDDEGTSSQVLTGLFAVDPARHQKVFTTVNGLECRFGTQFIPHSLSSNHFSVVEEVVGAKPSPENVRKALDILGRRPELTLDPKIYRVLSTSGIEAMWSPRLSRNGIQVGTGQHGWITVPLGNAAQYRWML